MEESNSKMVFQKYIGIVVIAVVIVSIVVAIITNLVLQTHDIDVLNKSMTELLMLIKTKGTIVLVANAIAFVLIFAFAFDSIKKKYDIRPFKEELFRDIIFFIIILAAIIVVLQVTNERDVINDGKELMEKFEAFDLKDYEINGVNAYDMVEKTVDYENRYIVESAATYLGCAALTGFIIKRKIDKV